MLSSRGERLIPMGISMLPAPMAACASKLLFSPRGRLTVSRAAVTRVVSRLHGHREKKKHRASMPGVLLVATSEEKGLELGGG